MKLHVILGLCLAVTVVSARSQDRNQGDGRGDSRGCSLFYGCRELDKIKDQIANVILIEKTFKDLVGAEIKSHLRDQVTRYVEEINKNKQFAGNVIYLKGSKLKNQIANVIGIKEGVADIVGSEIQHVKDIKAKAFRGKLDEIKRKRKIAEKLINAKAQKIKDDIVHVIAVKEVVKDIVGEGIKHLQDEAVRGQLEAINKKRTIAGKIFDTKEFLVRQIPEVFNFGRPRFSSRFRFTKG